MKIALFHDVGSGGAKRSVFEAGKRLSRKHDVHIYSLSSADHEYCDLRPWVNRHCVVEFQPLPEVPRPLGRLNQIQRWRDLARLDRVARKVASQIALEGYDVLYAHPSMWTQAPLILRYCNIPTAYHIHEPLREIYEPLIERPYLNDGLRKRIDAVDPLIRIYRRRLMEFDRSSLESADALLANSFHTAENVKQYYGRKAQVAYFGVDTDAFQPLKAVAKDRFVLSVGVVQAHKGFDFIIDALAELPSQSRPSFRIVANAVDEREQAYLRRLAAERNVSMYIESTITEQQLVERYNQAALFVYSAVREPFGFAPLEAMAAGTPVVAVSEGGVQETVVNGETGYLVPRDASVFADKMEILLADDRLRNEMGLHARERVLQSWTWQASIERIEDLLRSVSLVRTIPASRYSDRSLSRSGMSSPTAY